MDSKDLLEFFRVPKYSNVYVLGAFAKRVTLYSQQVRALNLIAALVREKVISSGREVVVVGGGIAGLTAAAGAACHGAKVFLLERQYGLMESQRNNRQRWIHPHIYDWPSPGSKDEEADLPLLGWSASYAEQVVNQIERQWDDLCLNYPIHVETRQIVKIMKSGTGTSIKWKEAGTGTKWIDAVTRQDAVIILAVGFGLEPKTLTRDSYWTEDDIDGGFRRSSRKQKWFISGFGDGALTDLMRLCITHFRHGKIVDILRTQSGIVEVEEQLKQLSQSPDLSPAELTKSFRALELDSFLEGLQDIKRQDLDVYIAGTDPFLYGPRASLLNRFIVRVLEKMERFTLLNGPTSKRIVRSRNGFKVKIGKTKPRYFDRVILRHGPDPHALEESFRPIWRACAPLRKKWESNTQHDQTQIPQWEGWQVPFVCYGPTAQSEEAFQKAIERFKVRASKLVVSKELRNDGSSTLTFEIKGLSVTSGQLSGMRFCFESTFGQFGMPELDQAAKQAGFKWDDDRARATMPSAATNFKTAMEATRKQVRKVAGTVLFPVPLRSSSNPVSFALTVRALNGDALSKWEFEQLYSPKERLHVDNRSFQRATEYMARIVWFPVDTLKLRITLPRRIIRTVYSSVFIAKDAGAVPIREVVDKGVLQLCPPDNSAWKLGSSKWKKQPPDDSMQVRQFNSSGQTWELSISKPAMGSCYSLDWTLPDNLGNPPSRNNEHKTTELRRQMLQYRALRMNGGSGEEIGSLLRKLYWKIHSKCECSPQEGFEITLLTYDESDRRLKVVDGVVNAGAPAPHLWEFWLPFGSGLAGVCFKQQKSFPLIYLPAPSALSSAPEPYLPLPNLKHTVLLAVPLDHPDSAPESDPTFEMARQRLGVIDMGSNSETSKLAQLLKRRNERDIKEIIIWCQQFCWDLCDVLHYSN